MPQYNAESSSGRGLIFCHYCGQGFKRDEHLERHVLTHTNVRPFRCRECKLTFKRKDLLRRHYRCIHTAASAQNSPQNDAGESTARANMGRIPIACVGCAQSKTRCDDRMPCKRCDKKGITCERRRFRRIGHRHDRNENAISKPMSYQEVQQAQQSTSDVIQRVAQDQVEHGEQAVTPREKSRADERPGSAASSTRAEIFATYSDDTLERANSVVHSQIFSTLSPLDIPTNAEEIPALYLNSDVCIDDLVFQYSPDTNISLLSATTDVNSNTTWNRLENDCQILSDAMPAQEPIPAIVTDTWSQWPMFCCNPITNAAKRTGLPQTLVGLKALSAPGIWLLCSSQLTPSFSSAPAISSFLMKTCGVSARDRLLTVTQQIWRVAKQEAVDAWPAEKGSGSDEWMDKIILLPPTDVLCRFLERYMQRENPQFHLFPVYEPGTYASLLNTDNQLYAGLMALMIIAQVTRSLAAVDGRLISTGLVAICRIMLEDVEWIMSPELLEISLSLIQLMQWSGDAYHMTAVLVVWERHAKHIQDSIRRGMRNSICVESRRLSDSGYKTADFTASSIRLLYSWISLDLELSLFLDTPPKLAIQEFPTSEVFSLPAEGSLTRTSLVMLLESIAERHITGQGRVTASTLKLLLHPLQCIAAHLYQCLATFDGIQDVEKGSNSAMGLASRAFVDELSALLDQWHDLYLNVAETAESCSTTQSSVVLYHIMKLNNLSSFPQAERLVREAIVGCTQAPGLRPWMRIAARDTTAQLLFHCGQTLRHLRAMEVVSRPLWWAAALYRVALLLSQAIICNATDPSAGFRSRPDATVWSSNDSKLIALNGKYDAVDLNHGRALQRFLSRLNGIPFLSRPDGGMVFLDTTTVLLDYCIEMLEEHLRSEPTVFSHGICTKLRALQFRWKQ